MWTLWSRNYTIYPKSQERRAPVANVNWCTSSPTNYPSIPSPFADIQHIFFQVSRKLYWVNIRDVYFSIWGVEKTFGKRPLTLSPITQPLEKPTMSAEAAETPESNSQQTKTKSSHPNSTSQSHCRKLLLLTPLPFFHKPVPTRIYCKFPVQRERQRVAGCSIIGNCHLVSYLLFKESS